MDLLKSNVLFFYTPSKTSSKTLKKNKKYGSIEKIRSKNRFRKQQRNNFSKVSPIRNKYFANSKPVSTLVEVSSLVKKACKIEVEVIAIKEK